MPSKAPEPNLEVVWEPIKGSSQELAIDTRCHHTLYHGTRGPGKTITQLMRFRRRVGIGYGSFWRGVIFDKEYKNFADIIAQSKRFFSKFDDGAKFISSPSDLKWVWPTGEELLFRHVKKLSDYDNFHGHEYPFIGWNELTKHATAELYDKLMSTNRSSFTPERDTPRKADGTFETHDGRPLPQIPLEVFSTTNPSGPGHNWVKRRFINCAKNGEVVRIKTTVFDPKKQEDVEVTKTQVAIFGSYRENIYLPAEYIAELDRLTNSDLNLKRAWLFGDWDVTAGGAIDDLWKREVHIVPRFPIPKEWYLDRSMDWGSSHPFSVGWWAEANGEEVVLPNGQRFCPAPGSLIQFAEWYGTAEIGTNKGLKLSASDVAEGVKAREIELMKAGWIRSQPWPGPADNQIRDVRESDVDTIEAKMAKVGIRWTESDKSPGSRRNGLQLVRDRLEAALRDEGPGLYFMSHCQASIETLPSLPRDDVKVDDVDTTAEDHCFVGSTKVCTSQGNFAISELVGKTGFVYSIDGELVEFHTVRKTRTAPCLKLTFSNGDEVVCTHDHRFLTDKGWIEARYLDDTEKYSYIVSINKETEKCLSRKSFPKQSKSFKGSAITCVETISKILDLSKGFMLKFTRKILEKSQKASMFTTSTETEQTTSPKTYSYLKVLGIYRTTKKVLKNLLDLLRNCKSTLKNGTVRKLAENGTESILIASEIKFSKRSIVLVNAVKRFFQVAKKINFARPVVGLSKDGFSALTILKRFASGAGKSSRATNTGKLDIAPSNVARLQVLKKEIAGEYDVFCLVAEKHHAFAIESGIIVHNCYDMVRYRSLKGSNRLAKQIKVKFAT